MFCFWGSNFKNFGPCDTPGCGKLWGITLVLSSDGKGLFWSIGSVVVLPCGLLVVGFETDVSKEVVPGPTSDMRSNPGSVRLRLREDASSDKFSFWRFWVAKTVTSNFDGMPECHSESAGVLRRSLPMPPR